MKPPHYFLAHSLKHQSMKSRVLIGGAMCLTAFALGAAVPLLAQVPSDQKTLAFEVASIKQNVSAGGSPRMGFVPGDRFRASNAPLLDIIRIAYNVQRYQIVDAPGWIASDRFDVTAMAGRTFQSDGDGPPAQLTTMLKNLLASRFGLATHSEPREVPTYRLVWSSKERQPGPHLHVVSEDCVATLAARTSGAPANPSAGFPPCSIRIGSGHLQASTMLLSDLAKIIAPVTGRFVTDATGAKGRFDLTLDWTSDDDGAGAASSSGDTPSIFSALQEQLGLRLEPARGLVDVLVIDHVERPTPD